MRRRSSAEKGDGKSDRGQKRKTEKNWVGQILEYPEGFSRVNEGMLFFHEPIRGVGKEGKTDRNERSTQKKKKKGL